MKKQISKMLSLVLAAVLLLGMLPVNANAANALAAPTDVKINKIYDYDAGKLITKYGAVSWKPGEVIDGVNWFRLNIYRDGKLVGGHEFGRDASILSADEYTSYDLSPIIYWSSGTYFFTVQAIVWQGEYTYENSDMVKSAEWEYTEPDQKLMTPTDVKWASSSGYALPKATWDTNDTNCSFRLFYYYSPTKDGEPTGCGAEWYVWDYSKIPYVDNGPGYYYFEVATISPDLSKYASSEISVRSSAFHYKLATPKPTVEIKASTGKPVITWKAVEWADYYDVYRADSADGDYDRVGKPTGTTFTDESAECDKTYYYRLRAARDNGMKSSYAKAISITTPGEPTELKITTQPKSVTVAEGETAKVTVKAQGDGLTYKWYYKDAGASKYTYTDSFKTNTYSVKMTAARSGRRVLCKVYDQYGSMVQSNSVTLNMKAKETVKIVTQPVSVTVAEGETAKVTLKATGDGLTYKWYYKDAGASKYTYTSSFTGNSYSVKMTDARNGRRVLCKVYAAYGNMVQSNSVLLKMK